MMEYTALGAWQSHPSLHFPYMVEVFFHGSTAPDDMINSKSFIDIKPCDSGMVNGYQVDEFTCTLQQSAFLCNHTFILVSQVKVSTLNHFPLELGCEDYSFLDQAVDDFRQGLDSFLTDSSTCHTWIHLLTGLMPYLLQSLQGIYAQYDF